MDVVIAGQDPARASAHALIVPVARSKDLPDELAALDRTLGGRIGAALRSGLFGGKSGELHAFPAEGIAAQVLVLAGLGDASALTLESARRVAGASVRSAIHGERRSAALLLSSFASLEPTPLAQAVTEGALLGQYRFDRYQTAQREEKAERARLQKLTLLAEPTAALRAGVAAGRVIAESTAFARDLSNEPGAVMTPARLADEARKMARATGLSCKVLGPKELEAKKMGGILAVGRGSANAPRLIVLEHKPAGRAKRRLPTVALVGKGITFDTGGISIKPAGEMDAMKGDMSGGAAVIAALRTAALLELPLHVVGIVPAAENRPSSTAYLPGDIVHTASGLTIEILNTDAEGRVVLSDGLYHAQQFEPDAIVDIATLTGAKVIALGTHCCAIMGNDDALIQRVRAAGDRVHERAWQLPLWEEYREQVRSDIADVKNQTGREGASITAGAMLARFVGKIPWAHLDIAGNERVSSPQPYCAKGATGFGVRLLVELLRSWD